MHKWWNLFCVEVSLKRDHKTDPSLFSKEFVLANLRTAFYKTISDRGGFPVEGLCYFSQKAHRIVWHVEVGTKKSDIVCNEVQFDATGHTSYVWKTVDGTKQLWN